MALKSDSRALRFRDQAGASSDLISRIGEIRRLDAAAWKDVFSSFSAKFMALAALMKANGHDKPVFKSGQHQPKEEDK